MFGRHGSRRRERGLWKELGHGHLPESIRRHHRAPRSCSHRHSGATITMRPASRATGSALVPSSRVRPSILLRWRCLITIDVVMPELADLNSPELSALYIETAGLAEKISNYATITTLDRQPQHPATALGVELIEDPGACPLPRYLPLI